MAATAMLWQFFYVKVIARSRQRHGHSVVLENIKVIKTQMRTFMNFYFAPLEGITNYVYRNVYEKHFGGMNKYFSPFISTNQHFGIQSKEKKDVDPENNKDLFLVPQILTNNAEQFCDMAEKMADLGYREINLNLGCPSKTVVTKKKGSGFLAYPEELDRFLGEIYEGCQGMEISLKTRIGMENPGEFEHLLEIYNQYPLKELIIHPRLQIDYYKNHPNMEAFAYALENAKAPLCYNGDLYTVEDIRNFQKNYPMIDRIMLGRGPLKAPTLMKELQGEERDLKLWYHFLTELCERYEEVLFGETNVLYKLKEHWYYLFQSLPDSEKAVKAMRKIRHLDDYKVLVKSILC